MNIRAPSDFEVYSTEQYSTKHLSIVVVLWYRYRRARLKFGRGGTWNSTDGTGRERLRCVAVLHCTILYCTILYSIVRFYISHRSRSILLIETLKHAVQVRAVRTCTVHAALVRQVTRVPQQQLLLLLFVLVRTLQYVTKSDRQYLPYSTIGIVSLSFFFPLPSLPYPFPSISISISIPFPFPFPHRIVLCWLLQYCTCPYTLCRFDRYSTPGTVHK